MRVPRKCSMTLTTRKISEQKPRWKRKIPVVADRKDWPQKSGKSQFKTKVRELSHIINELWLTRKLIEDLFVAGLVPLALLSSPLGWRWRRQGGEKSLERNGHIVD